MDENMMNADVREGIHPFAQQNIDKYFSKKEKQIVNVFKRYWYVTKAETIKIGASDYKYMLIKAPAYLANLFNITAEIIVIFSNYDSFEPRTLDAYDNVKSRLELGRIENLCGVLVSNDNTIEECIKLYNSDKETRTIIPFSYQEICDNSEDNYLFRNKFQNYFYKRDLFSFDDALKTDLYFFGRAHLVMDIINRHLAGQNSGLFGLRKTGKTSIIFDVKRKIRLKDAIGVFVSCQNPGMSTGSWVDSIYYVVSCIYEEVGLDKNDINKEEFNNLTATDILLREINKIYANMSKTVLLMFDEVEHITYGKGADEKWGKGLESVFFWKAIRSAYQMQNSRFTYCIVGTNPMCIEYATIEHVDNPIFCGVTPLYIPGFEVGQTRSMVRKLGRIMGLKFDETLYAKMTEEYGGHPFLIRHICSYIANKYPQRPVQIDRLKYEKCKVEFNNTQGKYFDMLLEVLQEFYPIEYEMLGYLAAGDMETFEYFATEDYALVQHLIGYGIIKKIDNIFDFQMDVIRDYIIKKENISKKLRTKEEKWSHLCNERGKFEIDLRKMVKQVLLFGFMSQGGEQAAKDYVISKIYNDKDSKRKYLSYSFGELFEPKKSNIYLKSLTTLIMGQWNMFSPFMGNIQQEDFIHMMGILNVEGRFDAHAKIPSDEDVTIFDAAIRRLGEILNKYSLLMS